MMNVVEDFVVAIKFARIPPDLSERRQLLLSSGTDAVDDLAMLLHRL